MIGVYEDDELNGAIKMDIEHYFTETGNGEPLNSAPWQWPNASQMQSNLASIPKVYVIVTAIKKPRNS